VSFTSQSLYMSILQTHACLLFPAFEKTITATLEEIKEDVRELLRRCNHHVGVGIDNCDLPVKLPVTEISQLEALEDWSVQSSTNRATLVSQNLVERLRP